MEPTTGSGPGRVAEAAPITRVIYASESCVAQSVYSTLESIRAAAMRHNVPLGVHTALLYQSGWFVQWKEGPGPAVAQVMEKVAQDKRHKGLRIVHSSRGPRLLSGPWSMAIVQAAETPEEMGSRVQALFHACRSGVQSGPPAVWRQLATPLRHPGATRQADPDAFQRILVCSAAGDGAFHLIQWLGSIHQAEVVRRRVAGAQSLDVGTDYVDFQEGDRVVRAIAMARNGLEVPLTQAFLADYAHILLLLSGDPDRDAALIQRVARACAQLPMSPPLIGVALDPKSHGPAATLARRLGMIYLDATAEADEPYLIWEAVRTFLAVWRDSMRSGVSAPMGLARS